jgi:hypothetical protein
MNGPHANADTVAADLTAETVRYFNYAAAKRGATEPRRDTPAKL